MYYKLEISQDQRKIMPLLNLNILMRKYYIFVKARNWSDQLQLENLIKSKINFIIVLLKEYSNNKYISREQEIFKNNIYMKRQPPGPCEQVAKEVRQTMFSFYLKPAAIIFHAFLIIIIMLTTL